MDLEITTKEIYNVTYNGVTKIFDNYKDAYKYYEDCERIERVKYMDELGIPEKGLYLIWTNAKMHSGDHWGVLMFNRKCVAHMNVRNGKPCMIYATEWGRNYPFLNWDDLIKNRDKYTSIWNSSFDRYDGAFRSYWGNEDDGATDFDYYMSRWNTAQGINIEKV